MDLRHRHSVGTKPHAIAAIAFGLVEGMIGGAKQFLANYPGVAPPIGQIVSDADTDG
jgi:hypothetical protein